MESLQKVSKMANKMEDRTRGVDQKCKLGGNENAIVQGTRQGINIQIERDDQKGTENRVV